MKFLLNMEVLKQRLGAKITPVDNGLVLDIPLDDMGGVMDEKARDELQELNPDVAAVLEERFAKEYTKALVMGCLMREMDAPMGGIKPTTAPMQAAQPAHKPYNAKG